MKQKLLALLLVLALILCLFAGCAKTETAAAEETAPAAEAAETAESAQETAPAAEAAEPAEAAAPAQAAEAEASAPEPEAEVQDDGTYTSPCGVTYPVADGLVVTQWTDFQEESYLATENDFPILPTILDATGIDYQFIEVSKSAASEQFQLMIASGDWPDMCIISSYYSGGEAQAYVDEVILDLTDLLPDYAPDYWDMVQNLNQTSYEGLLTATEGGESMFLDVSMIQDSTYTSRGLLCRGDWLEEQGLTPDDLTLIDGFTDALYTMYEQYNTPWTYLMDETASIKNFVAFDTSIPDLSSTSSLNIFLMDGQAVSGWVSDGYREYLEWFRQLYVDNIINHEFFTKDWALNAAMTSVGSGEIFAYETGNDSATMAYDYLDADNQDLELVPLGMIYADEKRENRFGTESSLLGFLKYCLMGDCENAETILQFMNYFYTEPGILMANYGTEGESYVLDADGNPQYTDLVLNNETITNVQGACKQYTISFLPFYNYATKLFVIYGELAVDAVETWTSDYTDTDRSYPSTLTLSTEEQDSITNQLVDCATYAQEMVLKFITGAEEITDESWDAYVDGVYGFGLQECLDVYQTAYEQYLRGERTQTMGEGGGAGGAPPEDNGMPAPPAPAE